MYCIAKTFQGLEPVLARELESLGATEIKPLLRAVRFQADTEALYRINLWTRTCLRVLVEIEQETVKTAEQLYDFARAVNWLRWFSEKQTFAVHAIVEQSPAFNNSMALALKVKDAVADQFRDIRGIRPSVDKENPDVRIEVYMFRDKCTLLIDSSGESLHRRGYRNAQHVAPINEVLAAGLVLMSGWDIETPFYDGFCGSGTILAEAAMIGMGLAPNLRRPKFGFESWKSYDIKLWEKVWVEAKGVAPNLDCEVIGSDIDPKAVQESRRIVTQAGVDEVIRVSAAAFGERKLPSVAGTLVSNPPYGERLGSPAAMQMLYRQIGDVLKHQFAGWNAWLIAEANVIKSLGLKPDKRHALLNGDIECSFAKYSIYAGSKRD